MLRSKLLSSTGLTSKGFQDWHCHLDRAYTFGPKFFEHQGPLEGFIDASLPVKQITVGVLHRGKGYEEKELEERMSAVIEAKMAAGEVFLNAIVDCSPDIDGRAFAVAKRLSRKYKPEGMTINVGAYPIFGFKNHRSDREMHLRALAKKADFLVGLPERDHRPGHADHSVTYEDHLSILIDLAIEHHIPLQVHVDQTNTPEEDGVEKLIEAVRWKITASLPEAKRPRVWAVHGIFSGASEERRRRIIGGLAENNIGFICAPHAALSMRQMRNTVAPIHNSIAPVRELASAGVEVRLGTDNIRDLFMPLPESPLLMREIDALASSIRYYNESVLGKIARGERLNETDLDSINKSLAGDYDAFGWSHTDHQTGH